MDTPIEDLCHNDERHPDYAERLDMWAQMGEDPPTRMNNCGCDNCFYGRDRLAQQIIRLQERLRTYEQ